MSHYDELGVSKNATPDEIKRAYRKAAKKTHPDKPGGDKEKFQAISIAYETLIDSARRKRYDSGAAEAPVDPHLDALQEIAGLLLKIVDAEGADASDIVNKMRVHVRARIAELQGQIKQGRRRIAGREKVIKRLRNTKGKPNVLADMLRGDISGVEHAIGDMNTAIEKGELMLKLLADYDYEVMDGLPPAFAIRFARPGYE